MIIALLVLFGAVVVLGWLMAAAAYVAIVVSMISRVVDHTSSLADDRTSVPSRWRADDARFLREIGIRP